MGVVGAYFALRIVPSDGDLIVVGAKGRRLVAGASRMTIDALSKEIEVRPIRKK